MDARITLPAYAKINLSLEVLGRRQDGFHEVTTILQSIDLADEVRIDPHHQIELTCTGIEASDDNLILRAAHLLREVTGVRHGCAIHCEKRISVGAGLGGGSSDAGAALVGLRRLWNLKMGTEELIGLAARLGADVPFTLQGGTAHATGTGATIAPLPHTPPQWLVLVPLAAETSTKTAEMYRSLTSRDFGDGSRVGAQLAAMRSGRIDYEHVGSAFERAARERWPAVARALDALADSGAEAASVSGAGPSVFGLYPSPDEAQRGAAAVRATGIPARVHRFVSSAEIVRRIDPVRHGNERD